MTARLGTDAVHQMDLLTAVMHELAHLLGYEHAENKLMPPALGPAIRWLPAGDATCPLAGEPSLLDDGALEPARLDAYFAALPTSWGR